MSNKRKYPSMIPFDILSFSDRGGNSKPFNFGLRIYI